MKVKVFTEYGHFDKWRLEGFLEEVITIDKFKKIHDYIIKEFVDANGDKMIVVSIFYTIYK